MVRETLGMPAKAKAPGSVIARWAAKGARPKCTLAREEAKDKELKMDQEKRKYQEQME